MTVKSVYTRFRDYSLGTEGASYSMFADGHFTLIEARVTSESYRNVLAEMSQCGKANANTLHITGWDQDHCKTNELAWILENLRPRRIEYPGYEPQTDQAKECVRAIAAYEGACARAGAPIVTVGITPQYIKALDYGSKLAYKDLLYHPRSLYAESNDNSTVKLFRKGSFNVASLGDVEHDLIGAGLRGSSIFCSELDVLILPHHGSEHSVLSRRFMKDVRPMLGVCSNDFDDKFGHPDQSIRDLFQEFDVDLLCTKTGDVIVESLEPHTGRYRAWNVVGTQVYAKGPYVSKKTRLLQQNADTLRDHYRPGSRPVIAR
ncbi:MAG: hypothetical protein WBO23_19085 [Burkholderiales bacterium]